MVSCKFVAEIKSSITLIEKHTTKKLYHLSYTLMTDKVEGLRTGHNLKKKNALDIWV